MAALVLSDFPTQFDGAMPLFTAEGCLPPGDFLPSTLEFETRFVDAGDHGQRASIYRGWNAHRRDLARAGIPETARQLLDGSYTTTKNSPGDIDIAVEVPLSNSAALRALAPDHPIVNLLLGPSMKRAYDCDTYPIYSLPKSDPLYASVTVKAIEYWTKWFGRSRSGNSKGRVWATTGGLW
jgi:hypothetical protein